MITVDGLQGRVAIVTGAGRNIGAATALTLARAGCSIVANVHSNYEELNGVVEEARSLGVGAVGVTGDASEEDTVKKLIDTALGEYGRIDIAVNSVGIRPWTHFEDITLDD